MKKITCWEVASIVIDEVTSGIKGKYVECDAAKRKVEQLCSCVDEVCRDFDAKSFAVDVDTSTMEIIVDMECEDFEAKHGDSLFVLTGSARRFSIRVSDEDSECVKVRFVFEGIWVPVS